MRLVKEVSYDQFKVEKLKNYLQDMADQQQPRPFEIFVDMLKVVPKTSDPNKFDNYEHYIDENTELLRIVIYNTDASPRNEKHVFRLKKSNEEGLGEIETIIHDKLAARDREHEANAVRNELDATKQKLSEAEDYIDDLQTQLEEVKNSKKQFTLGEIASYILEGLVRRNTHLLTKLPGGEALAGIIEQDNLEKNQLAVPSDQLASFQKKEDTGQVKQEHLQFLPFLEQLVNTFSPNDLHTVIQIIEKLSADPHLLKPIAELLNIKTV